MIMTRLPALEQSQMDDRQKQVYEAIASGPRGNVRGPLAIWLHRADLADKAQALGQYCRYNSSLAPRLSELAILTTARIWDAMFEWQMHVQPALAAGLDPAVIDSLSADKSPAFATEDEALVYEFTCELNFKRSVSDALYARSVSILGKAGTVDLVGILGYYTLISMTIKAFNVDPMSVDKG
jgi:4-carboxymuconolactone decarboxylase